MRKPRLFNIFGRAGEAGQAIVEFAIAAPLLFVMLFGMMEWGFLLWTKMTYVNATRDAARSAAVMNNWDTASATNIAAVKAIVEDRLSPLPPSITAGVAARITVQPLPSAADARSVVVSIDSQPYSPIIGLASGLVPASLSAATEFRCEDGL